MDETVLAVMRIFILLKQTYFRRQLLSKAENVREEIREKHNRGYQSIRGIAAIDFPILYYYFCWTPPHLPHYHHDFISTALFFS